MPLLSGAVSMTRFNVASIPEEPAFDDQAFRQIAPGSEVRESMGFLPFEPGEPYLAGSRRWAFRIRIDKLSPDPTAVKERFRDLVRAEQEATGAPSVGPKKRKELKNLAEEELIVQSTPRSKIIEGVIDRDVLYVGSTANAFLGKVVALLRRIGIIVDFKTPWIDLGEEEATSEILDLHDPVMSAHGSEFLKRLMEDPEIKFEPIGGYVRLQNRNAKITLTGAILRDLHHHVEEECELLAAKLITAETTFRLDALPFRISGCSVPNSRLDHWTEQLDERLETIENLWEFLDIKYAGGRSSRRQPSRSVTRERLEEQSAGAPSDSDKDNWANRPAATAGATTKPAPASEEIEAALSDVALEDSEPAESFEDKVPF